MVYITIRTLSQCIHGKNTIRVWKILILVLTSLRIGYSVITGLPIGGYSVITLTDKDEGESVHPVVL